MPKLKEPKTGLFTKIGLIVMILALALVIVGAVKSALDGECYMLRTLNPESVEADSAKTEIASTEEPMKADTLQVSEAVIPVTEDKDADSTE